MKTEYFRIENENCEAEIIRAAELLRSGELVAIPTETVYGLAANALDAAAVEKIFRAKGRPQDNPLIVHVADAADLAALVKRMDSRVPALAKAFWPGPLTVILPKANCIPDIVSAGLDSVALRVPAHPVARAIIRAADCPLAAPSANSSGKPSPTAAQHVLHDLDGKIAAIADGGACAVGVESTVLSLLGETPKILRPGGISPAQLAEVLGKVETDQTVLAPLQTGAPLLSPGTKYQHYAPRAKLTLVRGNAQAFAAFTAENSANAAALCFAEDLPLLSLPAVSYGGEADGAQQAQRLFDALRALDEWDITRIWAHAPAPEGIGLAVYNRLLRAAGFDVITL